MSINPSSRWRRARVRAGAVLVASALLVSGCATVEEPEEPTPIPFKALTLTMGALMPQTGSTAQFAPAMQAAFDLAVSDVNDAATGLTIEAEVRDSGDSSGDVAVTSVAELLEASSSVIVGPLASGVARKVIDTVVSAGVLMISPGATAPDFSTYADRDLFWRTAPSCDQEGLPLGTAAGEHGHRSLGIIAQADLCGAGLQLAVTSGFKATGGKVSVAKTFDPTTEIEPLVTEIIAERPDAVAILAGSKAVSIATSLLEAGYTADQLYFTGLAIESHAESFAAGTFEGAHATLPGLDLSRLDGFTEQLLEINPSITDFSYAAETYDAVIVTALAALAAQSVRGADIAERMREVSGGASSGEQAQTFEAAARIILDGGIVDYDGPSGAIAFDSEGDPAGAVIGLWRYQDDDTFVRID